MLRYTDRSQLQHFSVLSEEVDCEFSPIQKLIILIIQAFGDLPSNKTNYNVRMLEREFILHK